MDIGTFPTYSHGKRREIKHRKLEDPSGSVFFSLTIDISIVHAIVLGTKKHITPW
jgi:hypothetical protein